MSITYQEERIGSCLEEVKPILQKHYEEISASKKFPLNPDYESYLKMQANNMLTCVTCRDDGKLIGYIAFFVLPHMHYVDCKTAYDDIYFILPEYRKGMTGVRLFKKAEEVLKAKGVQRIMLSCKTEFDHTKIFEKLGYRFFQKNFDKFL